MEQKDQFELWMEQLLGNDEDYLKKIVDPNFKPPYDQWMRDLAFNIDDNLLEIIFRSLNDRRDNHLTHYGKWMKHTSTKGVMSFITYADTLTVQFTVLPKQLNIMIRDTVTKRVETIWLHHGDDPELRRIVELSNTEQLSALTNVLADKMISYTLKTLKEYDQGV